MKTTLLKKINIFSDIAVTFIAKVTSSLAIFVFTVVVAHRFGPEGKGLLTLVIFLPDLMFFLWHFGLGNAAIFFLSNDEFDDNTVVKNTIVNAFVLGVISSSLLLLITKINPLIFGADFPLKFIYLSVLITPFLFLEKFLENIFIGKQKFKLLNTIITISKILLIVMALYTGFIAKWPLYNMLLLILGSRVLLSIIYLITTTIQSKGWFSRKINVSFLRKSLSFGFRSYLACLLCYLILRSDLYMLSVMKGITDVGLYSVATNFIDEFLLISASASLVIFPLINKERELSIYWVRKISQSISVIMLLIITFSLVFGRLLIILLFGKQFSLSAGPFHILLIAMYFWAILSILTQFFASKNYPWKAVYIWIYPFIINVALNVWFIPRYGIIATAWSSVVAYFSIFLLHLKLIQKYAKISIWDLVIPDNWMSKSRKYDVKENSYGHLKRFKFIVNAIESFPKPKEDINILDVGCGTGISITMPLGKEGYNILGIDIDNESIEYAKSYNIYSNVSFKCCRVEEIKEKYDIIIASEIIEHIQDPVKFLESLRDKLNDNGIIIITTPNGYGWSEKEAKILKNILGNEIIGSLFSKVNKIKNRITLNQENDHVQAFTFKMINAIFDEAGLEIVGFRGGPVFGGPFTERTASKVFGFKNLSNILGDFVSPNLNLSWYFILKSK